jgi:ornithine carbamoyltransferase
MDFLDIDDLDPDQLQSILECAAGMKSGEVERRLPDATLEMVFEKPSTRTRVSFETGMTKLGGHAVYLGPDDIGLSSGREPVRDIGRVLGRYGEAAMLRLFDHEDAVEFAEHCDVPVINGLTDKAHPCQTLADLLTIREAFDGCEGVAVAWVGDGNNVAQSFVLGAALAGIDLTVCTPPEYGIDEDVLARADELGGRPDIVEEPADAVADADVVYTDVWVSMGEEDIREEKLAAFEGYQLNADLLADTDAKVMHCLPAHRGEEITDEILESDRTLAWEQAENRMWAQNALLVELLD